MTFVYPLLLGGLLLAGLPVLLHFLVRKKPKLLLFPAYRFLVQQKRSNTRNLRLRHLLLLLLRMLLILLICFALARPRLLHEQFGISRERPVALALIFDTTPSMEYKVGEETRLDLAKKRALELLDQLPGDCRVLILDAADPASFGREEWHKSLEKARQRIQSLTIQPMSVPVTTALDEAQRRFDTWDGPDALRMPRFVCVFSDRTKSSWDESAVVKHETDAPVLYFDVGIDEPVDFAIDRVELADGRQSFLEGEKIPVQVVVNATAQTTNTILVSVGEKVFSQIFTVEAGKPQTLALEIDAPTWGLQPGLHQAEVKWETATDLLPHNNRRFVTFQILPRPRVLVLADDLQKVRRFAFALECVNFAVTSRTTSEEKIDLNQHDAVFLVGVKAPSDKLWKELGDYVKTGHGVCIIPPGEDMTRAAYNSGAAKRVMPATVGRIVESAGARWDDAGARWEHPFLSLYRKWFIDGTTDLIQNPRSAFRYWQVEPFDKKSIIIAYDSKDKDAAVVERPLTKDSGKVLLLTTPMDEQPTAWNNYDENLNSFYLALNLFCGRYLCAEPENQTFNHQFGQKMPVVTKKLAFPRYLLTAPDFSEEIRFEDDRWNAERVPKAGNFSVIGTDGEASTTLHKFSVNIAPEESDLTRISVSDIEVVLGKDAVVPQDRRRSIVETLNWDEPLELFPWLMIALLFLLALENLLANRYYRRSEPEA